MGWLGRALTRARRGRAWTGQIDVDRRVRAPGEPRQLDPLGTPRDEVLRAVEVLGEAATERDDVVLGDVHLVGDVDGGGCAVGGGARLVAPVPDVDACTRVSGTRDDDVILAVLVDHVAFTAEKLGREPR